MKEDLLFIVFAYRGAECSYSPKKKDSFVVTNINKYLLFKIEDGLVHSFKIHLKPLWDITEEELERLGKLLNWEYIIEITPYLKRLKVPGGASIDIHSDGTYWIDTYTVEAVNHLRQMGFCLDKKLVDANLVTFIKP